MILAVFIGFLFCANLFLTFTIYPFIIKKRLEGATNNKKIVNSRIGVSKFRWVLTGLNCIFISGLALYEWYHAWKYPFGVDDQGLYVILVISAFYVIITLFRLVIIFPKKYFLFQNNKMCYHNGIKEICVEEIDSVTIVDCSWRIIGYWYLVMKVNSKKKVRVDILLFSAPEELCAMINNMVSNG